MRPTGLYLARRHRQARTFRPTWATPALSSHQQLDAGIAARQHASRKDLKKSRAPFANYFRSSFPLAPRVRRGWMDGHGRLSAYDAVRLRTDPALEAEAPWGQAPSGVRTHGKRPDVLEAAAPQFGEDSMDQLVDRLLEVRFAWDKEDDLIATDLVPPALYAATEHCAPYAARRKDDAPGPSGGGAGDYVMVDGVRVSTRRPYMRGGSGGTSGAAATKQKPKLDFHGVECVPTLLLEVARGPLLSSPFEAALTVRWKADNRLAASVSDMVTLRHRLGAAGVVGLPPRSALLLLKAVAADEMEDPALEVALAIAMGEHYNGYTFVECLEVLRALRRLALVRALPTLDAEGKGIAALYATPAAVPEALAHYVQDVAPQLVEKVWSRLPEQSSRLLHNGYYVDWFDLLRLAVEVAGHHELPANLPNPVSEEPYAAKYFFFRYTLGWEEELLRSVSGYFAGLPAANGVDDAVSTQLRWLCASLLVRLAAEALGDLLHHVSSSLHRHAQLALEEAELALAQLRSRQAAAAPAEAQQLDMDRYLDQLPLARPLIVGSYQLIGRRRPRRVRVRLLPFEAFPTVTRCLPTPFASITQRATRAVQERHDARRARQRRAALDATEAVVEATASQARLRQSPFTSVLMRSAELARHIERASAALQWSRMVLQHAAAMAPPSPPADRTGETRTQPPQAVPTKNTTHTPAAAATATAAAAVVVDGTPLYHRQHLCASHVASLVQANMDSLFEYIQWGEMESDFLLPLSREATTVTSEKEAERQEEEMEEGAMSSEERLSRAKLRQLQQELEGFQTVVADLLDLHEDYFGGEEEGEEAEEERDTKEKVV